ncbi:PREDICTED: transient receptor potential cation channel protein painless [Polistes dominula]|uniref:Transient receptor potential cation channel protein painless n=1 Tax=Polistes dominula TaxID=743375 RepID=A0ABM1J8G3_POLDO|nr:PREDICTED: transient receptor potential cation channel protein painless [Polistes dominula]XP_015188751.1 PREDICTED: transient receptor potential cation channel protein painless [Polistes dominula]
MDPEEEALQMHLLREHDQPVAGIQILYKVLMESLRVNDLRAFKNLLGQNSKGQQSIVNVNYVYPNRSEETLLDVACKNGRTEFVKLLLENGANPNRVNEAHNRAPIHFAVEGGHVTTLKVLLNNRMINPNIEAAQQTALHIAIKKNHLECIELLLENGASPNIPNNKGITALHFAAMKGQRDIVTAIQQKSKQSLDLDTYKDYNGQTTRQVLEKKFPDIVLPPSRIGDLSVHNLRYFLNANDEINFLRCLEKFDYNVLINDIDELLEMAVERNFDKIVKELLDRMQGHTCDLTKAAIIAIQQANCDILRELLKQDSELANELIIDACLELGMPEKQRSVGTDRLKCLKLILDQDNVDVRCTDNKGNTPLHYAARAGSREAVSWLLEKGSYIGHMNKFNVPPIADIPLNTLAEYFDDCLQTRKERTNEYTIEFNYRCLMPHDTRYSYTRDCNKKHSYNSTKYCEMDTLLYMSENSALKHLLKHPLLSSFLHLKWYRIRHLFYLNFAFYVIFYILLNTYILGMTYDIKFNVTDAILSETNDKQLKNIEHTGFQKNNLLWVMTAVALFFLAIREIIQLVSSPCHYISSLENWLEMTLIILGSCLLNGAGPEVGAVAILVSAWEVVILIGQYPRMSTGIEMFKTVSWNFMRFLFLYAFLILAFALAFFTLFKDGGDKNFPDPGHSLFKTIIMLTGEFDANDIPFISHPILSRFVFVLFVFLIAIVLFNLLNGLAVSDTAEILGKAELIGLISRIRLISYIENVATGPSFLHKLGCLSGRNSYTCNPLGFLVKRILLFPNYLKDGKLVVKPHDNFDVCCPVSCYGKCLSSNISNTDSPTLRIDSYIVKKAKEILLRKRQTSENEKIFTMLQQMAEKLATINTTLNTVKRAMENNNLNIEIKDPVQE